jgi:small GTP-binding protein
MQDAMSKPLVFKVVLVGEVAVGKTSLFVRLKDDRFIGSKSTLGLDKGEVDFDVKGKAVKIDLWDTAGSEKFRTLTGNYYHGAKAAVYIYDITEASTLYSLGPWLQDAQKFAKDHLCFLVGNKSDLDDEKDLEDRTVETFNKEKEFVERFEVSAKTGKGVREAFQAIAEHLVNKHTSGGDSWTSGITGTSPLDNVGAPSQSSGGCCK